MRAAVDWSLAALLLGVLLVPLRQAYRAGQHQRDRQFARDGLLRCGSLSPGRLYGELFSRCQLPLGHDADHVATHPEGLETWNTK